MKEKNHLLGLDLLKIMTLLAIAILHANEFVFYQDTFPLGSKAPVWFTMSYYARVFTLGGQILVALIYLLFGYSGKSKKSLLLISGFAFVGQIILTLIFQTFEWDIYAYICVTNLLIALIPFFHQKNPFVLMISFLMLFFPTFWFEWNTTGPWPMLPWFFLALGFYQAGVFIRDKKFLHWRKFEYFLWPILFLLSVPSLGAYYWVPIGPGFYQFAFNQSPFVFWPNFLPFVFFMRISFLWSVQKRLLNLKVMHFISRLFWIRHLGLVYLISLLYLGIGMHFSDVLGTHPWLFDVFFIGIMPISELLGRILVSVVKWFHARPDSRVT